MPCSHMICNFSKLEMIIEKHKIDIVKLVKIYEQYESLINPILKTKGTMFDGHYYIVDVFGDESE